MAVVSALHDGVTVVFLNHSGEKAGLGQSPTPYLIARNELAVRSCDT